MLKGWMLNKSHIMTMYNIIIYKNTPPAVPESESNAILITNAYDLEM
jgi:hypothetical protein